MNILRALTALLPLVLCVHGCTYYQVAPAVYSVSPPHTFDRSWQATLGAFDDQGVRITHQDRAAGEVRGTRGGIDVAVNLRTLADGSVRVEFNTAGETSRDPTLIDRISSAYNRRMGR